MERFMRHFLDSSFLPSISPEDAGGKVVLDVFGYFFFGRESISTLVVYLPSWS